MPSGRPSPARSVRSGHLSSEVAETTTTGGAVPGRVTDACFERTGETELDLDAPVLIEGLPGYGLVAAIAVDRITDDRELEPHGRVTADAFPAVTTFEDGLVKDLVRVYAGTDPDVLTLRSDLALPERAIEPLADCVVSELAEEFGRAVFLAGAPAETDDDRGTVRGVATTDAVRSDLDDAGVELGAEPGLVGGVTGGLVRECHRRDVPAALLIVDAHPYFPDPTAAAAVVDEALEPLVGFDIDTTPLAERAERIEREMQQVAQQYRATAERREESPGDTRMFQ